MYHKNNCLGITLSYRTQLLTPPREEEEIQPYHKVWRPIILQTGILIAIAIITLIIEILGITLPEYVNTFMLWSIIFAPLITWLILSYIPDRSVPQPRTRLLAVLITSSLLAEAVAIPFVEDIIQINEWISLISALERIASYTFTVGIVQATVFYVVLRFIVWKSHLRERYDPIAYAQAAAIGFTLIMTLTLPSMGNITIATLANRILAEYSVLMVSAILVAYGMSASRFDNAFLTIPAFTVGFSAISTGLAIPLYSGLLNASFTILAPSNTNPLLGLVFSSAFVIGVLSIVIFLMSNAEKSAREAQEGIQ